MVILSKKEWIFLLIEMNNIEKAFGPRKIIALKRLTLCADDKIAVVGKNGAGKTTLLRMIAGEIVPDAGRIKVMGCIRMIPQLHTAEQIDVDVRIAGRLGLDPQRVHSGGEQTKQRITAAFSQPCDILLADEPTTNLDIAAIHYLQTLLCEFRGGLMIVSHDRALLGLVCNKVLEIGSNDSTLYHCGYDAYVQEKEKESLHYQRKYEQFDAERKRLGRVADEKALGAARMRKTPRRMGNSEARLHKMGNQKAKAKIQRSAHAARSRINQLDNVQKPWQDRPIVFDVPRRAVHSAWLITASDVSKAYGDHRVLEHCRFGIPNGKKTAIVGPNGAGKTTLIDMILSETDGVAACQGLKIGYFSQDIRNIDDELSVLGNALSESIYDACFVRTILARLLFRRDEIHKDAGLISGGERIKLAIAKILLSDYNLLILDEPTNYLDIESRCALEAVLSAYTGAVLFVSHDRAFLENVADRIICIADKTTQSFEGGYAEFAAASVGG